MKRNLSFLLTLIFIFYGFLDASHTQGEDIIIELLSPQNGEHFTVCSYSAPEGPPVFQWNTQEPLKSLEIQFTPSPQGDPPKTVKVKASSTQLKEKNLQIKSSIWKKVLLLPGTQGGMVSWKAVGTKLDKSKAESPPFSFNVEAPEWVGNPAILLNDSPPVLSWKNNCNTKFKVWFWSNSNPAKKKALSFTNPNPEDNGGKLEKQLTSSQWTSITTLGGESSSNINWYVESWDVLKRHSETPLTGFSVQKPPVPLQLESYSYKAYLEWGGPLKTIFTIQKPKGWEVIISGMCTTLAFLIRDPNEPLRQILYFGMVRPVYRNQAQKDFDKGICEFYVYPTPCPLTWTDAPVVNPLTVENFFYHWPAIAEMKNATSFMPEFPKLEGLKIVSDMPQSPMLTGAETTLVRGVFTDGDPVDPKAAQGQFLATVMADPPTSGTGSGYMVFGATSPVREFNAHLDKLVESLNSFTITSVYFNWCVAQLQQQWGAVAAIGQTLSEASDIIWEGWQNRTHNEDILAEKYTDVLRDVERVYDPDTGNVYEFEAGWYSQYAANSGKYNNSNLQLLPDDCYNCWMAPQLDGPNYIYIP